MQFCVPRIGMIWRRATKRVCNGIGGYWTIFFWAWKLNFTHLVSSGAVHIMARKNNVLAPLERVTWDQWLFFRLDDEDDDALLKAKIWYDPREPNWSAAGKKPSTATGTAGERLYSIYIA